MEKGRPHTAILVRREGVQLLVGTEIEKGRAPVFFFRLHFMLLKYHVAVDYALKREGDN